MKQNNSGLTILICKGSKTTQTRPITFMLIYVLKLPLGGDLDSLWSISERAKGGIHPRSLETVTVLQNLPTPSLSAAKPILPTPYRGLKLRFNMTRCFLHTEGVPQAGKWRKFGDVEGYILPKITNILAVNLVRRASNKKRVSKLRITD